MDVAQPNNSPFDALQTNVFRTAADTMGYVATWQAAAGGDTYTARVLFNNPTEQLKFVGVEFNADDWEIEYFLDDFPGLKDAVDARSSKETITIGEQDYRVRTVIKKHDGKTYRAQLQPI